MNTYHHGTEVRMSGAFQVGSVDTDPTDVNLEYKNPGGTETTIAKADLTSTGTGHYYYDVTPTSTGIGIWHYRFTGTGVCAVADEEAFMVLETEFAT